MENQIGVRGALLILASVVISNPSWAQQGNLEKAVHIVEQQARTGKGEFVTYLTGAAAAYRWANTSAISDAGRWMYCPPADLRLDGRNYARIAVEEYKAAKSEYAALPQYPMDVLTLALLRGLGKRFPCPADPSPSAKQLTAESAD